MTDKTGQCMCGAVTFSARDVPDHFSACHCEMCRRWSGSALLAVHVPVEGVTWKGEAHIRTLQTSDWAERAFCQRCGTPMYYHLTVDGNGPENYSIPLGVFDETTGMTMTLESFVDCKAGGLAYAENGREQVTRADTLATYGMTGD